jgi:hypothetical protein
MLRSATLKVTVYVVANCLLLHGTLGLVQVGYSIQRNVRRTPFIAFSSFQGRSSREPSPEHRVWKTQNDFRTFLNQCTIQSFLFLIHQMRDIQTVAWLEDFTQPTILFRTSDLAYDLEYYTTGSFVDPSSKSESSNALTSKLLRYHGLGAMNTTRFPNWESYFLELLKEPKEIWRIESPRPHIPSYDLEINPASLCARLLSVREQIAKEWSYDLGVVANMSREIVKSYFEKIRLNEESGLNSEDKLRLERLNIQDILFLDWNPNPESDLAPSPLRQGNFDLLVLLATQEAVHRILNHRKSMKELNSVLYTVLEEYYLEKMPTHFMAGQNYGRYNDFLQGLLSLPPSVRNSPVGDKGNVLVDPIGIVEIILKERESVALEWQAISRDTPNEHFGIRRQMLNKLMGIDTEDIKLDDTN